MDDVDGDTLIIVEGEIDKLSCEAAGFANTVSVPDGAPSPKAKDYTSKFEFLENCEEFLSKIQKIILAVDNDEPGKTLEEELARRLGRDKCFRVQWPEECKDANEVLQKCGAMDLAKCLENARPYPVQGIFEVSDIAPNIETLFKDGYKRGDSTGWPCVTSLYTARPGEWTLITGIPGHGKSEFLDALAINLAMAHGWTFAVFSPENQPLERHFAKLAEKYIGKPFAGKDKMSPSEVQEAKTWLHDRFVFLLPDEDSLSVDAVLNLAKTTIRRKGVKGVIIDPWNELDHQRDRGMSETDYISQSLTKIRRFARAYGVHIWLVAHPFKMQKDKITGAYPVPTPYDVSGSAHWRNKADNCLAVFREFDEGNKKVNVYIQKIRFKEIGRVGYCTLEYDIATGRYSDPLHEENPF
jgi:twinkle protein